MIGVDMIGAIRRAYFEEHRPIKEIVRTLSVSRATVRKVIRSRKTEFKYERGGQPTPTVTRKEPQPQKTLSLGTTSCAASACASSRAVPASKQNAGPPTNELVLENRTGC